MIAAANAADQELIKRCAVKAVDCALARDGGVMGEDEDQGNELRALRGPAETLLLWSWGRVPTTHEALGPVGDETVLAEWAALMGS